MLVTTKGVMNHSMKLQTLLLIVTFRWAATEGAYIRKPTRLQYIYDKVREVCMIQVCYREGVLCMKIGED